MNDKRKGVAGYPDSHPCEIDRCGAEVAVTVDEVTVLLTLRQAVVLVNCLELGPGCLGVEALTFQRIYNTHSDMLRLERHGAGWEIEVVSHSHGEHRFSADWTGDDTDDAAALVALLDWAIAK